MSQLRYRLTLMVW